MTAPTREQLLRLCDSIISKTNRHFASNIVATALRDFLTREDEHPANDFYPVPNECSEQVQEFIPLPLTPYKRADGAPLFDSLQMHQYAAKHASPTPTSAPEQAQQSGLSKFVHSSNEERERIGERIVDRVIQRQNEQLEQARGIPSELNESLSLCDDILRRRTSDEYMALPTDNEIALAVELKSVLVRMNTLMSAARTALGFIPRNVQCLNGNVYSLLENAISTTSTEKASTLPDVGKE